MKRSWIPLLSLVTGVACGGGDAVPAVTRVDSAGIEVVTYAGPDVPLPWTFDSLFALGGAEDGEDAFYEVRRGTVGADAVGNLYVLDASAKRIVVFDSTGAFVRAMGGPGGGPGEMEWPVALVVSPDGRAGAFDIAKRGLVWFGPDGAVLPQEPMPPGFSGGTIAATATALVLPSRDWSGDVDDPGRDELLRAVSGDTVRLASVAGPPPKAVTFESCGMRISGVSPVFWPRVRWAVADDRVALTMTAAYEMLLLVGADSAQLVRRPLEPPRATTEDAMQEIGDRFRVMTPGGARTCDTQEVVEQLGVADRIPVIAEIVGGPDGTWWVRRRDEAGVDVYAGDGAYLGTLPGSSPYPVLSLPGGRIASVVTDDVDVDRLVVYRLRLGQP